MKNFYAILTFLFLVSCSTSSDVVQHGFIQKRKYTKGFTHHKKDRSLFKKNSFSINKKTNEIVNDVQNPLKKLQSGIPSVTANEQKKTPEATALIASNNNDIIINTDELLKENYFIKNDISELIKTKNKPFKKIRAIKEIIKSTDGDDEAKDNSKRNFILNLLVPGLGTMLNGKIGLGILQLLLFAAGIFGAYWIFWNTSIHTIFPILISVMAYGWSIYSGYVSLNPDKSVNAKLIAKVEKETNYKPEETKEIEFKSKDKTSALSKNKKFRLKLKNQNEKQKIINEKQKIINENPELKKLNNQFYRNMTFGLLFTTLSYITIPVSIVLALGIYLLYAFASYAGGDIDTVQMEQLIIACLSLGFLPLLIGVYSLIRSAGRRKKLDEKINKFKN